MPNHRSNTLIIIAITVLALVLLTSRALLPYVLIGGAIIAYLALRRPQRQHAPTTHPHDHQHRYADERTELAPTPTTTDPSDNPDQHPHESHGCGHGGGHSSGHGGHTTGRRGGCC